MDWALGVDLRIVSPPKEGELPPPPEPPIVFDFLADIRRVIYWHKTGDWPVKGSAADQAPKVRLILSSVVNGQANLERMTAMRQEMALRMSGIL